METLAVSYHLYRSDLRQARLVAFHEADKVVSRLEALRNNGHPVKALLFKRALDHRARQNVALRQDGWLPE